MKKINKLHFSRKRLILALLHSHEIINKYLKGHSFICYIKTNRAKVEEKIQTQNYELISV